MAQQMKRLEELMQMWEERFPAEVDWSRVPEADLPQQLIRGTRRTFARPGIAGKGRKPYYSGQEFFTPEEAYRGRALHRLSPEGAKQAMSSLGGIMQQHTAALGGLQEVGLRENIMLKAVQDMLGSKTPEAASAALDELGGAGDKGVATVAQAAPESYSARKKQRLGAPTTAPEYRGSPWMMKVMEYLMDPREMDEEDPLRYASP